MKDQESVHRVHDEFAAITLDEIDLGLDDANKERVHLALDVLCWILDHEHNVAFAENVDKLRGAAAARGYIQERVDDAFDVDPFIVKDDGHLTRSHVTILENSTRTIIHLKHPHGYTCFSVLRDDSLSKAIHRQLEPECPCLTKAERVQ